jgi:hypothetical protein
MSLKDIARDWVRNVISNHVGSNIRRYEWTTYVGELRHNMLGAVAYLLPIEGTVVDANEQFTLVKISANKFSVILTTLLSEPVAVGLKIAVKFYNIRRFDGSLADGSEDASVDGCRNIMLTGTETLFPVKWEDRYLGINEKFRDGYREIQNPYLRDLITQMEKISVNGGWRRIVNVLVDAGAKDLDFVDPPEEKSAETPPAILATVATQKFAGRVEIFFDRASDTYGLRLTPAEQGDARELTDIHFDELGDALQLAVDDESWMQAKVTVLKAARKPKAAAAACA